MYRLRVVDLSRNVEKWCDGKEDDCNSNLFADIDSAANEAYWVNDVLAGNGLYWLAVYPVAI